MNKEQFFRELEECLQGEVSNNELAESMVYYRDYFRSQEASGYSEAEVIASLGSPRLIARPEEEPEQQKTLVDIMIREKPLRQISRPMAEMTC